MQAQMKCIEANKRRIGAKNADLRSFLFRFALSAEIRDRNNRPCPMSFHIRRYYCVSFKEVRAARSLCHRVGQEKTRHMNGQLLQSKTALRMLYAETKRKLRRPHCATYRCTEAAACSGAASDGRFRIVAP